MSNAFKVAAIQAAPSYLDLPGGIERAVDYIEQAARAGAKLVVFPETWLPCYPNHIWLGSVAWSMQFTAAYFRNSVEAGSAEDEALAAAARDNDIQVSMGLSERAGGSLYIAQWHYGQDGRIIQRRRKLKPTHVERTVYGEGDGSDLAVNRTPLGRIGQLSCWEHLQPLSKYAMYSQDEQIHCAAWPNFALYRGGAHALGPEVNTAASRIYAVEGGCYVIAACALVTEQIRDRLCEGDPQREQLLISGGGFTRIYAPDGQSIGNELAEDEEGLVLADIDLDMIAIAKAAADPAGHYARPDVTRLLLDATPQRPVVPFTSTGTHAVEPASPPFETEAASTDPDADSPRTKQAGSPA